MDYATYQKPNIAGITMASGTFTQQAIYDGVLSYKDDAQKYADGIGAKLVNALGTPATNFTFKGIDATNQAQPWMVTWDGVQFFFAGIAINQQVTATKAVIGIATTAYPGTWKQEPSGVWDFVPQPVAPVTAPKIDSSGDPAAYLALMGGGGLSPEKRDEVLLAIAAAVNAKVSGV